MDNRPIGIFDSGLGGLTVLKELSKIMPNEDIVYFGDTARVPYGTKSRETILKYAAEDISFLISKNVKYIIIACGTVSSNLSIYDNKIEGCDIPITGVVYPSVIAACNLTKLNSIGVIGTTATIKSGNYQKHINENNYKTRVVLQNCPLFVPLVENGFVDDQNEVTCMVANIYLKKFIGKVDTLILGCTHYPIIKSIISKTLGNNIKLVDTGIETARFCKDYLINNNMITDKKTSIYKFYVSDDVYSFTNSANLFLNFSISGKVDLVEF